MSANLVEMQELLARCRDLPEVPEPVFRLLELLVARASFDPHEAPTAPRPRPAPLPSPSAEAFRKATEILKDGES